jgi:hypothetical protein
MEVEMQILEREEFQRWRDHPLTAEFLKLLDRRRLHLMEAWATGQPLAPEQQAQAVLLGQLIQVSCDDLRDIAGLEPLDDTP